MLIIMRYRTIITKIIFIPVRFVGVRMYRIVFELIRENVRRDRQIDNFSDCGKWDMRTMFQERCRNRI